MNVQLICFSSYIRWYFNYYPYNNIWELNENFDFLIIKNKLSQFNLVIIL